MSARIASSAPSSVRLTQGISVRTQTYHEFHPQLHPARTPRTSRTTSAGVAARRHEIDQRTTPVCGFKTVSRISVITPT